MKRTALLLAAVAILGLLPDESQAFGHRKRGGGGCCESSCAPAPCGDVCATQAPCAPVQPAAPQMVEVTVTKYKAEWKERQVTENICKMVPRTENYTYTVLVPVTKQETRKVTVMQRQTKEVDVTYTVMVPKTYQETRTVQVCNYQTSMVTNNVQVCRTVRVPCVDACGNCTYTCQQVMETVPVTRCVTTPVMSTKEITVNVVRCEAETRQGKRTVVECIPVVQDVTVNVCSYERQERQGTRTVCEYKTEAVSRTVKYCEMVPYTETIQVPQSTCGTSYVSTGYDYGCCSSGGGRHGRRGH